MNEIYVAELIDGITMPHVWIQEGSRFFIEPKGIGGVFRIGSPMLPFKVVRR